MQGWLCPCLLLVMLVSGARTQVLSQGEGDAAPAFPSYQKPLAPRVERDEDGLQPLYYFARSFLQAVQPNSFPGDLLTRVLENGTDDEDVAELVHYEGGYLVCLFLAVLYLILMPIAGALLLWMFFGRRGWPADPPNPGSTRWSAEDCVVSAALVLTTLLLCIGVILAFATNSAARANMRPGLLQLHASAGVIERNLDSIRQEVDSVLDQYSIPKAAIERRVEDMDDTVGERTIAYLQSPFQDALADFTAVVEDAAVTSETLRSMEDLRGSLQGRQKVLQDGLSRLNTSLKALETSCSTCQIPDISNLTMGKNYSLIRSVKKMLDSIPTQEVFRIHWFYSNETFHSLPRLCTEELAPTTSALLAELNSTQVLLQNSSQGFPSMLSLREAASELRGTIRQAQGPLDHYDHARWAVAITLLIVLLVTVVLLLAAVSIGLPVFFNPGVYSRYPYARLEDIALWMFQICILLMCAFSWLYIILVFITLLFGGNAHTLLCRSFSSGEIFTFLDKREDLFTSLAVHQGNQSSWNPPRAFDVFHGCRRGESLFHSMKMNQTFDLEEILDPIKYLGGFNDTVRDLSVSTGKVKLLSDPGRQVLVNYRKTGLENYRFDFMTQLLAEPVVNQNLSVLAKELNDAANQAENVGIKAALLVGARNATVLHDLVVLQEADAANMSGRVMTLKTVSQSYKAKVDATLSSFNSTQTALNVQVPLIIANVSQATLESVEEQLVRYMDWARRSLVEDVLGCGWLARAVDNMYTAACLNVVDPWNGFWLSLGWCCAFLVPAVFLSLFVAGRLPPHPEAPPQAFPAFRGNGFLDRSDTKEKGGSEKKGDRMENNSEAKSNIYMTLSELGD